ncbi:MAG: hypothetical protein HGA65_19435, partial [Oscillochloris sp.]|nr:hypothetical protein [Oscillochloris sp.]
MMQKFETRARQFSLVGGTRQATSDLMAFAEPGSSSVSDAHKGTIYILVEAGEPVAHSREACLLAARTIQRAFNEDNSYSIAAAMRRAITAANKAVYQRNIGQSVGQRAGVGVTVAVIKESDLFVAQVQPAQAYVLSEGALRAMPAHPSWDPAHVSVAPFSRAGALGASLFIDPEFFRCSLRLGEAVLLCSSSFSPLLSRPDTEQFMRLRDPAATLDQLFVIAAQNNLGDAHALFVELQPIPRSTAQPEAKRPDSLSAPGRPLMRRIGGWVSQITGGLTGTPRSSQSAMSAPQPQPDPLTTMPEQPRFSVNPPSLPAPLDIGEDLGRRYARARQEREQRQSERLASSADLPPSTYLGEEIYPVPSSRRIDLGDGPALAASARPYRSRYEMRPFVDLTWRERLALPFRYLLLAIDEARRNRKVRPTNLPPAILRGQGLSYRRNRLAFPWLLLLGLTLVIAALIVYGMTLTRQNDQQLALEYLTAAETRLANVREAANESTALDALDLARQAIDEVRASPNVTDTNPPLWLRYQEIQREYERALAAVQHQTFLDSPTVLATHPQPNGGFGG